MRGNLLQKELTAASGFPSPSRITWRGRYETTYQLLKEEKNETGATTEYKYDFDITPANPANSGKLIEIIQPDATLPDGTVQTAKTVYEYNAKGQPTAVVLADGTRNEIEYGTTGNEKSRVVKQTSDAGSLDIVEQLIYDANGFISEKTDGNNNTGKQEVNALGLVEKVTLPAVNGSMAEYSLHYNSDKKTSSIERPVGLYTDGVITDSFIRDEFERDVLGYLVGLNLSSNTAASRVLGFSNNFRGFAMETLQPDGSILARAYDERGLVLTQELKGADGTAISSSRTYNRVGKLTYETNESGQRTAYEYDGFSRLSKVTRPNGTIITYTWGSNDLLQSEEITGDDGSGAVVSLAYKSYTYDEKKRKITETVKMFVDSISVPVDVTTTFYYNSLDRIEKGMNNRGGITRFQYDGAGRIVLTIDAMGNETHYTYDANGNQVQIDNYHLEPGGTVTILTKNFEYDERNRRTAFVEPDGAKISAEYDDRDLLCKLTDQDNMIKEMSYDSFRTKLAEIIDPGGLNITRSWTSDNMSRITAFTDPLGEISTYAFDSVGRNYKTDFPNGFSCTRIFNSNNQVSKEQLASGAEFEYEYDTVSRIVKIRNTVVPVTLIQVDDHEFEYDGLDRVLNAKLGVESVVRSYDSLGRLLTETMNGNTMSGSYDDAAGTVQKIWPDGRTEKLSHDLNGVLTKIEETVHGTLGSGNAIISTFKPSGPGFAGETGYGGGTTVTNSYDERKRIIGIAARNTAGLDESVQYCYNTSNLRQVEAIGGSNTRNSYFEFDKKYRLLNGYDAFTVSVPVAGTQASHDAAIVSVQAAAAAATHTERFTYDDADARISYAETGSPAKNYTYLPGHRAQNDGTNAYTHLTDGMLQSDGVLDYESDALGRIIKISSGGTVITEISYDAFGRPSGIKENGRPDKSFNYLGAFVEQENESGTAVRHISTQPVTGTPLAYHSAGATYYPLFDARYNMIALMDDTGVLLETYRYQCFGQPFVFDNTGAAVSSSAYGLQPVFGGLRYLSAAGLFLSRRRLMNPVNGAFLSADPKGYDDASSLYAYAAQDPVNNIDPNGEIVPLIIAAFVIGGAVAGLGYSIYDASNNPEKYQGWQGGLRVVGNTLGGAAIGGLAIVGGEAVLAIGGAGMFASGAAATTLTATETFLLYGASSVVSGGIMRGGFNQLFPEYIDPVSVKSVAIDFFAGGTIGTGFRALTNWATTGGFATFPGLPGMGFVGKWLRYGSDLGGSAPPTGSLGAYPGRIGAWLDQYGIRQGMGSNIINKDIANNIFAAVDTQIHEGFHALVVRYLPTFRNLSLLNDVGAIARYPEEVVAYALGHGAAGRLHGIPFAPFEAFNSLGAYTAQEVAAAKIFWGRLAGAAGVGMAEQMFNNEQNAPNEMPSK
jgi:RHS repeat-associated protein